MRKLVTGYFWKEAKYIGLYLGCVGIFSVVLFLYNVRTDGLRYAVILSGFLFLLVLLIDFVRYCRHYDQLSMALATVPYEVREFPEAVDAIEVLYQKRMKKQQVHVVQMESEMRIGRQDMLDYYGLWVHQIKTPIAAMRLLIQTEESQESEDGRCAETEMQEREAFLRNLKMELFKIEQYVEMVLCYLRKEDMSSDLVLQWYSLDKIVRQAVKKYSPLFIMKKIRLEYKVCDEMVLTDEKWLVFVFEQLLSNALKYTPAGTIAIYLEEGECGRLVIEDTGIGIQTEDLPRIFEKGFTGYNGRQEKKSTGIGLYLCKSVCDKLNHGIAVESETGKGTRIYLELKRRPLDTDY